MEEFFTYANVDVPTHNFNPEDTATPVRKSERPPALSTYNR